VKTQEKWGSISYIRGAFGPFSLLSLFLRTYNTTLFCTYFLLLHFSHSNVTDGDKIFKVKVPPLAKGEDDIHFFGVSSEGGLWVLAIDRLEGWEKGVGRIENAANMEEKCKEIEKLGGVFYANPRDCSLLDFRGLDGPSKKDEL